MTTPALLPTVARLAESVGIPPPFLTAVEHRAKRAARAYEELTGYRVLGNGVVVLAHRIVDGAVLDHARGVLERRCV